jgi:acyl-CoA synthetase (AMP-forming)/AMP-acid ligase II/thioesterase domain-containing protein/acyl carrier protein
LTRIQTMSISVAKISHTVSDLLAGWADRTPDATAILAPGKPDLTYARLWEAVRSACDELCEMGTSRKDRIAIVLPNGPEMAVAFLAVSSCAVSAPLNPAYGTAEFEFYLSDLKARALIVSAGSESPAIGVALARGTPVLELTSAVDAAAGSFTLTKPSLSAERTPGFSAAEDTALMLHTSGTTSRPKIVPLTQENLCLSAHSIARWFSLTESDCCLNIMPLFHIHGLVAAVLSSLAAGARVVCTPGFDATKYSEWMAQFRPTWYTAVPTMHQAILARIKQHKDIAMNHHLRFIRSCSSSLSPSLMSRMEEAFGVPVVESYGMTEASHQIASNPLPPQKRKAGSVGLAAGPEVAIMDAQGNLLQSGQTGEIVLRGRTIALGYESNPEANRKAFTQGWFRTGDEGHLDEEGYLFITARIKEIINRGGEKISPREIDEMLLQYPGVLQAVAFSIPHAQLGEDLAAAVVFQTGATASESDLRQFVAKRLAYFKVPRVIRILDEIPKGATGKIQRIGMSERLGLPPIDDTAVPKTEFREPHTPLQRKLLHLWREVLAVRNIGIDDNFFALGGDSLLATTLMLRLTREMGSRLSLVDFMDAPTITGVAERMESEKCDDPISGDSPQIVAIQLRGSAPPLLCAPGLDGSLLGFWSLSRRLGPEQPIFAFSATEASVSNKSLSIEEMATAGIQALHARQLQGPYYLLGNCFGGFVAYEMARRLTCDGAEVPLLVMLDCFNHGWRRDLSFFSLFAQKAKHSITRSRFHLKKLAALGMRRRISYFREHFMMFRQTARDWGLQFVYDSCVHLKYPIPRIASDVRYANRRAERLFMRRPYSGRVALLGTTDPAGNIYPAPMMGWKELLQGRVDVYDVPGDHLRMLFDPAVSTVARILQELIPK